MVKKRNGEEQAHRGPKADKLWREALMRAVNRMAKDGKTRNIELLAQRTVIAAANGDIAAIKEIGDRIDGRPVAQINVRRIGSFEDLSDDELAALARGNG